MKKVLLGLMVVSAFSAAMPAMAQIQTISIGNKNAWKPAVGDDVIYNIYEETPQSDSVGQGTLEKKVTAVSQFSITEQITLTMKLDSASAPTVTTKTVQEQAMNIQMIADDVDDCAMDVGGDEIPVTIVTPSAGTFPTCLGRPMIGNDLDGDNSVINDYMGYVPFGLVRMDSVKISSQAHSRIILKQITLGQQAK